MRQKSLLILGVPVLLMFVFLLFGSPEKQEPVPQPGQTSEQLDKQSYERGYTAGYKAAKQKDNAAYQQGYEAAQEEIGNGLLTRSGLLGLLIGFSTGLGGLVYIRRQDFSFRFREWKKRIELRRAFRTIPQGLTPEIDELAHHIAHEYVEVLAQFQVNKNYLLAQYTKRWRPKLKLMMKKSLNLLELVQELESVRTNINEKDLTRKVRNLKRAVQNPASSDDARNAAAKSLQRAKQTQQELQNAQKNFDHCTRSLREIGAMLESMRLKVSNLKINTHESDVLDQLSCELEAEVQALDEALCEVRM